LRGSAAGLSFPKLADDVVVEGGQQKRPEFAAGFIRPGQETLFHEFGAQESLKKIFGLVVGNAFGQDQMSQQRRHIELQQFVQMTRQPMAVWRSGHFFHKIPLGGWEFSVEMFRNHRATIRMRGGDVNPSVQKGEWDAAKIYREGAAIMAGRMRIPKQNNPKGVFRDEGVKTCLKSAK
jgi:hypothetical protein